MIIVKAETKVLIIKQTIQVQKYDQAQHMHQSDIKIERFNF